jgi:hypothetical protein
MDDETERWGTNHWYKISYWGEQTKKEGYIFGAFLEPVEHEIKE